MTFNRNAEQYTYDDKNRLVQVEDAVNSTFRAVFAYDGLGRLRTRTDYVFSQNQWVVQDVYQYVYGGWRVIQERSSGSPTASYTRGNDLSGTLEGAGGIGGLLARSDTTLNSTFTPAYYQADAMGNVTYMLNSQQTVVAWYRYDPFGRFLTGDNTVLSSANLYRFSSKQIDPDSGAYYFGYRWHDPAEMRWINRDPLGDQGEMLLKGRNSRDAIRVSMQAPTARGYLFVQGEALAFIGPNLYRYDENNPVCQVDPTGLWTVGVGVTLGIQLGPINIFVSAGFTGDTQGNFGGFATGGVGAGLGAGIFAGVSLQASNAKCNNDLKGPFGYGSLGGAAGGMGSLDGFWGNSPDGPVFGGGGTVGVGLGAGGAAGMSETTIKPIW